MIVALVLLVWVAIVCLATWLYDEWEARRLGAYFARGVAHEAWWGSLSAEGKRQHVDDHGFGVGPPGLTRRTRFPAAPWAPPLRDAEVTIFRHAPRLARDLRLEVDEERVELERNIENFGRVLRAATPTVGEAVWNVNRAFQILDEEDNHDD